LRLLEVEMLSVKEALLLMFEQDRLFGKKTLFWGVFEPYKWQKRDVLVRQLIRRNCLGTRR
jgi:hypothetical protein